MDVRVEHESVAAGPDLTPDLRVKLLYRQGIHTDPEHLYPVFSASHSFSSISSKRASQEFFLASSTRARTFSSVS